MSATTVPLNREDLAMTSSFVAGHPDRSGPSTISQPRLRPVSSSTTRGRKLSPLVGALTAVGVILVTLFAQLGLSIAVSEGAYESRALQSELKDLTRVERVLSQNTAKLASPQNLAENAATLGMVQNSTPATLRLSDGAVLGSLGASTSAVAGNVIPNQTLDGLPVVDADGLLTERNPEQAAKAAAEAAGTAIAWEGPLPAPQTH